MGHAEPTLVSTDLDWIEFFERKQAELDPNRIMVAMTWEAMSMLNNLSGDYIRGLPELIPGTDLHHITVSTFVLAVDVARSTSIR